MPLNEPGNFKRRFKQFSAGLASQSQYQGALRFVMRALSGLCDAGRGILLITRETDKWLSFEKAVGFRSAVTSAALSKTDPLHRLLHSTGSPQFIQAGSAAAQALQQSAFIRKLGVKWIPSLLLPLNIDDTLWGAWLCDSPASFQPRLEYRAPLLLEAGRKTALALRHARMTYLLRRTSLEKDLLLALSRKINATLDLDQLLETILDSLQQVVPYDKGSIFLLDPRGKSIARSVHRGPAPLLNDRCFAQKREGLCAWVLQNNKAVVVHDVSKDPRYFPMYLDTQSELDVPLVHHERILGVLNLESNQKAAFQKNQRKLVQAVAGQAAVAIDHAWLYAEAMEKKEMERELNIARQLQRVLLPRRWPVVDGYDFAALNIPSRAVGGDLYDCIQLSSHRIGITIGDVAGKGIPGALLMATLYSTYRSMVRMPVPVNEMIFELNNVLKDRISNQSYITFFYGVLSTETDELFYCNAGHCPPILLHADGRWETLEAGGTVLGFVHNAPYELGRIQLQAGDLIFLYTDGITEAMDPKGEFYGEDRLLTNLREWRRLPVKGILRNAFRTIKSFSNDARLQDDFTAMAVAVKPKQNKGIY
ncbi:MAG TPA: SpoIIE family protein phosphatase [bacterium]|nr:SpoIIE family protein phosphatase [bacterium]